MKIDYLLHVISQILILLKIIYLIYSRSFFTYLCDAYWNKDKLYLLCATWEKGYEVNTILVLDSALTPSYVCRLPGKIYNTICANENYIYAMNYEQCAMGCRGSDTRGNI